MDATGLRAAIRAGDWDRAAGIVAGRLGVGVDPGWLGSVCGSPGAREWVDRSGCLGPRGSDESAMTWMKSRIVEAGLIGPGMSADAVKGLAVALHIGFLFLEESPEMLARLPEPGKAEESVARSKVFRTHLAVEPVDIVAARVAPGP